jgi:prephenate dehydratase
MRKKYIENPPSRPHDGFLFLSQNRVEVCLEIDLHIVECIHGKRLAEIETIISAFNANYQQYLWTVQPRLNLDKYVFAI